VTLFHNPLWQSREWEVFQRELKNTTFRIQDILIIKRQTALGKSFFEIPRAALAAISSKFWSELATLTQEQGAVFTRIFPADQEDFLLPAGARTDGVPEIFPENTLVLDVRQTPEELLTHMKPKGRYNIHLAEKKEVQVAASDDVHAFYELVHETTQRDGFSGHPEALYRAMLESFAPDSLLLLAKYQEKVIAGGIFLFSGGTATYYYGASSNEHRDLMAPYLVQWRAIEEAQERNCQWYDFLGIAPEGATKEHKLFGVSQFKEKLGGVRVRYAPNFEVVHQKGAYLLIKTLQKIRRIFRAS